MSRETCARGKVKDAIARGEMSRGSRCRVGGDCKGSLEAHHPDYDHPLWVVWLCRRHHQQLHRGTLPPHLAVFGRPLELAGR